MFWAIIVLPWPCGAMSTTFRFCSRKSRRSNDSTAARSIRLGQDQSKSAFGLKRPIWLRSRRCLRLRQGLYPALLLGSPVAISKLAAVPVVIADMVAVLFLLEIHVVQHCAENARVRVPERADRLFCHVAISL